MNINTNEWAYVREYGMGERNSFILYRPRLLPVRTIRFMLANMLASIYGLKRMEPVSARRPLPERPNHEKGEGNIQ